MATFRVWPAIPVTNPTLQNVIPSYLYQEYSDDPNLQAFVTAQNGLAQQYVSWFNNANLPIYTGLSGPILDWVGQGLYGLARPSIASGIMSAEGPYASVPYSAALIPYSGFISAGNPTVYVATDDVYQRVLTWHFYKGDGRQFTLKWLKRRVMRFLYGKNGTDFIIAQTSPVSVAISANTVTITLTGTPAAITAIFQACVASAILELPTLYTYVVNT